MFRLDGVHVEFHRQTHFLLLLVSDRPQPQDLTKTEVKGPWTMAVNIAGRAMLTFGLGRIASKSSVDFCSLLLRSSMTIFLAESTH